MEMKKETFDVIDLGYILEMDLILGLGNRVWNDLEERGYVTLEIYNRLEDFYESEDGSYFNYKTEMYQSDEATAIVEEIIGNIY